MSGHHSVIPNRKSTNHDNLSSVFFLLYLKSQKGQTQKQNTNVRKEKGTPVISKSNWCQKRQHQAFIQRIWFSHPKRNARKLHNTQSLHLISFGGVWNQARCTNSYLSVHQNHQHNNRICIQSLCGQVTQKNTTYANQKVIREMHKPPKKMKMISHQDFPNWTKRSFAHIPVKRHAWVIHHFSLNMCMSLLMKFWAV